MHLFPDIFRTCLILAMIPLSLWSGRISPGCIFADGHIEWRCSCEQCCSAAARPAAGSFRSCNNSCCAHSPAHRSFVGANQNSIKAGPGPWLNGASHRCHPLAHFPIVVAESGAVAMDPGCVKYAKSFPVAPHPAACRQNVFVVPVDSGPQKDRLSMIQSLRI